MSESTNEDPSTVEPPPAEKSDPVPTEDTEYYIEAYHAVSEWIQFCRCSSSHLDCQRAFGRYSHPNGSARLLFNRRGVHLIPLWNAVALSFFGLFLFFLILSGIAAFHCINPFRRAVNIPLRPLQPLSPCGDFRKLSN